MKKIAVLGFGTVGSGVVEIISGNSFKDKAGEGLCVKAILDIRDFSQSPFSNLIVSDFDKILTDNEIDIVVETIGGINPALEFTEKAFKAKKNVVTSNKELVATKGAQLIRTARENDVAYLFEASVGGGIPIIRPLNNCLVANEIHEIMGILNGTTNYILTQMIQTGQSFERALSDAQQKGYAERDPMADIEGIDTCRKIAILSALCYGRQIDSDTIPTQGISNIDLQDVFYSEKNGYTIKLIGRSKKVDGNVYVKVSPLLLPKKHPLAGVEDVFNAILVRASATGDLMFYGKGAGKMPTASAVVADCINIIKYGNLGMPVWENGGVVSRCNCDNIKYYIRVKSEDKADTKEQINSLFAKAVWLDTQENDVAFITDKDDENNILDNIQKLRSLIGNDNVKATYQVED